LRGGSYIEPWHQFALSIIASAMGDRPVYFASSGNAADHLGLRPYIVREGLAFRLNPGLPDPETMRGIVELSPSPLTGVTGIWLNVERTQALAWEVFVHRDGLPDEWEFWPHRAVLGIPSYYSWVHYALYQAGLQQNRPETAEENLERADAWARLAG